MLTFKIPYHGEWLNFIIIKGCTTFSQQIMIPIYSLSFLLLYFFMSLLLLQSHIIQYCVLNSDEVNRVYPLSILFLLFDLLRTFLNIMGIWIAVIFLSYRIYLSITMMILEEKNRKNVSAISRWNLDRFQKYHFATI